VKTIEIPPDKMLQMLRMLQKKNKCLFLFPGDNGDQYFYEDMRRHISVLRSKRAGPWSAIIDKDLAVVDDQFELVLEKLRIQHGLAAMISGFMQWVKNDKTFDGMPMKLIPCSSAFSAENHHQRLR
jgi:hypothetical protein